MFRRLAASAHRLRLGFAHGFPFIFPRNHAGIKHYLLTIALMGVALFVRLAVAPINAGLQYVTFFPSVTLAAIFGGYRTGLLATIIGMALSIYIFTPPYYSISIDVLQTSLWSNIIFLADGIIVSFSIEAMHRYRVKYEDELNVIRESEAQLKSLNDELVTQYIVRKQAEEAMARYAHDMGERVKEISCLRDITMISQNREWDIERILDSCVRRIPHGWLDPQRTCARIRLGNQTFESPNFRETKWKLAAAFPFVMRQSGVVEVFYMGDESEVLNDPFLNEEHDLINSIAVQLCQSLERRLTEEALREQEEFFRMITENVEDFIGVVDLEGRRLYNSPSYARLFGDIEAMKGTDSFAEIHADDRERIKQVFRETVQSGIGLRTEYRFMLANGEIRHMESCGGLIKDSQGKPLRVVVVSHDITGRKMAEEEINRLAFYDTLTQLPNRRLEEDRQEQAMAASKRSGRYGAVMFLDLDNFKPLNDKYGHSAGDLLLIEVAHRISSCVREMDTVARFGGDEFVVVLSELDEDKAESTKEASIVAEKIRAALAEPYVLKLKSEGDAVNTVEHQCTSSIGVMLFIGHEASAEDIRKWADIAMYQAKNAGRNQVCFYDSNA